MSKDIFVVLPVELLDLSDIQILNISLRDRRELIIEGRNKDDILKFFKSIPSRLLNTVSAVCSDLYEGYINAAKEVFGNNIVVADRFHVSKLYRKKLIDVRKSELKRLKSKLSKEEYQELKPAVAILLSFIPANDWPNQSS